MEDHHEDEICNISWLSLGLGFGDQYVPKKIQKNQHQQQQVSFTLIPKEELEITNNNNMEIDDDEVNSSEEDDDHHLMKRIRSNNNIVNYDHHHRQDSSFGSIRRLSSDQYINNNDIVNSTNHNYKGISSSGSELRERKKLRLSKEQSTLLEESFKLHTTLNPAQKQALAQQLNLKTRQVEVWFQNRRARTKLKQTEVDCEFLKKCCERLNEENRRLKKELNELRSLKLGASQLYIQLPKAATLTICPSCDQITRTPAAVTAAAVDANSPPQ
ncbi:homeobox-leucine zipper protein HOX18-like [Cucumis melo var. makuwa]|uniref:Homeobox-leucine zipper protein HOX18-like n=2 Tax=Cucumis melo TaxID=3656 RepID=A0A1S3BWH2_CUCME|nr:homeobox-leucine zipper protein HOX18-like [Cucumis melo]KAA0058190.1 homeobox-leucine zipper protein HOX18-like [Cucumis melo var. makuwa]